MINFKIVNAPPKAQFWMPIIKDAAGIPWSPTRNLALTESLQTSLGTGKYDFRVILFDDQGATLETREILNTVMAGAEPHTYFYNYAANTLDFEGRHSRTL
jgi:hypothetical protein